MIKPKITVGIPNYNGAKYLKYAIESVLCQTYTDYELIITDDGSIDNSGEIIQEYRNHPRVRIILSSDNRGLSYRLNEQISLAEGQYFCRMDADDIMMPDRLEKQLCYLEKNQDVDVVGSAAIIIGEDNKILGTRSLLLDGEYSRKCRSFIHPTVMGKISFFRSNRYSEEYSGAEDTELWMRCRQTAEFRVINEPLLFYRDPLRMRVKSYLSRLSLVERILKKYHVENQLPEITYLIKRFKLKLQIMAVRTLDVFGATSIWAKRRNAECPIGLVAHYQSILDERTTISHTD